MLQELKTAKCWVEAKFQLATGDALICWPVSPITHLSSDDKYMTTGGMTTCRQHTLKRKIFPYVTSTSHISQWVPLNWMWA